MRKLLIIFLPLIISNIALSQASFVIKIYDYAWLKDEEISQYNSATLCIVLDVINEGNKSDVCDELNNLYLDCSNKKYTFGDYIFLKNSIGTNEIVHPFDTLKVILAYSVPKDADELTLKFYNLPEAGSKYIIESFINWEKNNRKNLSSFEYWAEEYFNERNFLKSFLYCSKAISLNPKSKANFTMGNIYIMIKNYDDAIKYYNKSFGIVDDYLIYDNLGYAYLGKKYYYTAIEYFNKAIISNSKSYDPLLGISIAYYYSGNYEKSKEYYKKAEKINSHLKSGMIGLSYLIEVDGVFYGEEDLYALNQICKMLGYNYNK